MARGTELETFDAFVYVLKEGELGNKWATGYDAAQERS